MQGDWFGILFFAAIAAVIFIKLRSILGQHNDEDLTSSSRLRGFATQQDDNIVELHPRTKTEAEEATYVDITRDQELLDKLPDNVKSGIQAITQKDPQFSLSEFLEGAQYAFDMILAAFAKGDTKTLEELLSKEIYRQFSEEIKSRETRGETLHTTLVSVLSTEITAAKLEGKEAFITVSFVTEQMSALKNRAGDIISGSTTAINKVRDVWTFSRTVSSSNPNWTLVATNAI